MTSFASIGMCGHTKPWDCHDNKNPFAVHAYTTANIGLRGQFTMEEMGLNRFKMRDESHNHGEAMMGMCGNTLIYNKAGQEIGSRYGVQGHRYDA